jgi:hypothetical protein
MMEPRPTPFGRSVRPQSRLSQPATITEGQFLELKNGLWDAQQEIARLRDQVERLSGAYAHQDQAITRLDNRVYAFERRTDPTVDVTTLPATPAEWEARGEAWEQLIAGISTYARQGVTGDELAAVIGEACVQVQIRTGIDTGRQR